MKFNWGLGITVVTLSFIGFILSLVYRCSMEKVELVSERYYENEIRYQERINQQQNASSMSRKVIMGQQHRQMAFQFPSRSNVTGMLYFFRPDNARLDFQIPVMPLTNGVQQVSLAGKKTGNWKVMIQWSDGKAEMYQEERIWLD